MKIHAGELTLGDLVALVKTLPSLGEEVERFMKDLKDVHKLQPLMVGKKNKRPSCS